MYNDELETEEQESQSNGSFLANFYYNNKVLVWIFLGIIIFILLMSLLTKGGSNKQTEEIKYDVAIYPVDEEIVVALGESTNLFASVTNNPNARIDWAVEDPEIVKVDNGNVVGLNYGRTKVTATYIHTDDKRYYDETTIVVADGDPNTKLTAVSFKDGDLFMPLYSTYEIRLVITPSRGFVENKTFTSNNTNVVTVDNKGLVTAVGEGEATISFSVNGGEFRRDLRVYVDRSFTNTEIIVTPEKISFDGELRKIKVGTKEKLTYSTVPENADKTKLTFTSSDESVLTVDDSGWITGIKSGNAIITISSVNGSQDKIDVEVESDIVQVTDISLSVSDIYLVAGQSQTITPIVSPDNASNKQLSYASSNSSIASVTANDTGTKATITGNSAGSATIIIRSTNDIERRLNVVVTGSGSNNNNNNNNSGSNNGGGGGSGTKLNQGFSISSSDYYGEKYVNATYELTKPKNNGGTAPITITVKKTDSSVNKLVVVTCSYPAGSGCTASASGAKTTTGSVTFTMCNTGVWVIRVFEYNSSGKLTRTTDKYIWIKAKQGNCTSSSSTNNGSSSSNNNTNNNGSKAVITCNPNATYTGKSVLIATCSGGTFSDGTTSKYVVGYVSSGYSLTCTDSNGVPTTTKCYMKQASGSSGSNGSSGSSGSSGSNGSSGSSGSSGSNGSSGGSQPLSFTHGNYKCTRGSVNFNNCPHSYYGQFSSLNGLKSHLNSETTSRYMACVPYDSVHIQVWTCDRQTAAATPTTAPSPKPATTPSPTYTCVKEKLLQKCPYSFYGVHSSESELKKYVNSGALNSLNGGIYMACVPSGNMVQTYACKIN